MRRVAIIQARMTSTRLPGKILADLDGQPMLSRQLARLRRCRMLDALVLATTVNATDDPVAQLAQREGVACFRGDEHDVLSRYVGAARMAAADVLVRVTADCPLIEPTVIDRIVESLLAEPCDYASNTRVRSYPRGLDAEAMHADVLYRMERLARSQPAREHVTWFLHRERPELFVCRDVVDAVDNSDLRWTVDTPDDLALVRRIYRQFGVAETPIAYADLIAGVRGDAALLSLNAHVRQATE